MHALKKVSLPGRGWRLQNLIIQASVIVSEFVSKVTWTIVRDAAVTIPQTKQLAYRPSSTSSSPVSAIIQQPGPRLRVKVVTVRNKASARLFRNLKSPFAAMLIGLEFT